MKEKQAAVALFQGAKIRKTWHEGKWWFVVEDVVFALTNSNDPKQYVKRMRQRDPVLAKGWVQNVPTLEIETEGGRQKMNCASTEGVLRIIQSIPSPKAEPFKLWLAHVGYERIREIEDPEVATARTREIYKAKGYSDAWIEKRMRGIEIRATLTDAWKDHGVKEGKEYEILTAEISKAAFGMTPSEYKKHKGLKSENLRDHMNDLELIFSMLGEAATTEITKVEHPQGFHENKKVSKRGGSVAREARVQLEKETGRRVVSRDNYLKNRIAKQEKTTEIESK